MTPLAGRVSVESTAAAAVTSLESGGSAAIHDFLDLTRSPVSSPFEVEPAPDPTFPDVLSEIAGVLDMATVEAKITDGMDDGSDEPGLKLEANFKLNVWNRLRQLELPLLERGFNEGTD